MNMGQVLIFSLGTFIAGSGVFLHGTPAGNIFLDGSVFGATIITNHRSNMGYSSLAG